MKINGTTEMKVLPGFTPKTLLAVDWVTTQNGNYHAVDRTASADVFESEFRIYGKESYIDGVLDALETYRDAFVPLTDFSSTESIFGADVDVTGTVNTWFKEIGKKEQGRFKGFRCTFRVKALTPSFVGTASLPALQYLDFGYSNDATRTLMGNDTYNGTTSYYDLEYDAGIFEGTFLFSTANMQKIRRYLAGLRGSTFSLTGINGVTEPFGSRRGGSYPYNAKIIGFEDLGMMGLEHWKMKLKFAEVV